MHVDLNSCFATVEQQANSHLRGKPLVIAAYTTPNGCVVAPSIEAKTFGIKTGMTVREARLLCSHVIVRDPDPALIRDVHIKFRNIFQDYSPHVTPKSIDEAIIDFSDMTHVLRRSLSEIGTEIKYRLRHEIGEWISCSIGIGPNRFLAKLAAGLQKPDGLVTIDHRNLLGVLEKQSLTDLPGINTRFEARLNAGGITNAIEFYHAPMDVLKKQVFQSILGYYWYQRLRGWEVDAIDFERKSYGQDYALQKHTNDPHELSKIIMKLCEKMGRRLRNAGYEAKGIHVSCIYRDGTYWHKGKTMQQTMFTTLDLFRKALWVLNHQPDKTKLVSKISVSCFNLDKNPGAQFSLFDNEDKERLVQDATDKINAKYGEFVITPALMMGMNNVILDRISFGNVRDLENLYDEPSG